MKITVIAVGKIGQKPVAQLCDEYRKRLGHHLPVEILEVRKGRGSRPEDVMASEEAKLRSKTPDGALTVAMSEEGRGLSSVELAQEVNRWMVEGRQHVVFYIGGAHGLASTLKREAKLQWSLSKMTFPHDLARMLLWEQLYRALTIIRGEPYHK